MNTRYYSTYYDTEENVTINAHKMREADIELHGDNPLWPGWPMFIRNAMNRCGIDSNCISMGSLGCNVIDSYGKRSNFYGGNWIVKNYYGNLEVYTSIDFNNRFIPEPENTRKERLKRITTATVPYIE